MKKNKLIFSTATFLFFCVACSEESVTDEFNEANGNVEEKLIQSISYVSPEMPEDNTTLRLSYNNDGSLNTISDGIGTSIFIYENNDLKTITGSDDNINAEEFYRSPYNAFEVGQVVSYDANGNPETIEFFEQEWDDNYGDNVLKVYTANMEYDDAPNPFYYTMKSGGLIDLLDNVRLNFSMTPQSEEIVQARLLFPLNNLSQIIYKNEEGEMVYSINANYTYDDDNYPVSGAITAVSVMDSEQVTASVIFTYRE